jgi:hypothetical protein
MLGICRAIPGFKGKFMLRKLATGVALSAALLLPLAACSSTDNAGDAAKAAASPSPKPAELLGAAVTKTKGVNVKLSMGLGKERMTGAYDATKKLGSWQGESSGQKINVAVTESEMYMVEIHEGVSLRMQMAKLEQGNDLVPIADPIVGLNLLAAATTATSPSPNIFKCTLDLAKVTATGVGTKKLVEHLTKVAPDKISAIPFTAKVDAQGYVTDLGVTLPKMDKGQDLEYGITMSDFGAPVTVTIPTSNVMDAPDELYKP